ncbi:sigma-70 family RNA polymerase sigma factor [Erythrobacter sp. MTPC3]|uniref:sigma-70 family RNA polymerase sigma factor n=1 Tax=Erythrobacter sp. MTPC3 TaxID=3056564 RepID=UPI0036F44C81
MKHDQTPFAAAEAYSDPAEVDARVRAFVPMVQRAAWHIFGMGRDGLEIEDLVQSGMIALTQAARRHAGPTEDGFAAYAKMRVRGAMFDLVRKTMPDSRRVVERRKKYDLAVDTLQAELGRMPLPEELAQKLGFSEEELREVEASQTRLTSIDDSYDDSDAAFADQAPDPFAVLSAMDDRERLILAMGELPKRSQLVLQLFFVEELNLTEISEILEVSVPRVHQLRAQALGKLKAKL